MSKQRIDEIVGYEKEKAEILQLRKMLHEFPKYRALGVRIPRGLMIVGEPGVGKTVLMRALPDRGIHCCAVEVTDDDESTTEKLEKAIQEAKKNPPAVVMIDEFDKLAGGTNLMFSDNGDITAGFIRCLDKLSGDDAVLVVATCNNLMGIDPSLMRPGRFDRTLEIQLPNEHNRQKIVEKYMRRLKMPKGVRSDYIARMTVGMSCADIQALINESGIIAAEKDVPSLEPEDFRSALNRFSFNGCEHSESRSADEDYKIAVHEAGHALVAMMIAPDCLYEVSILEQGDSSGHIKLVPDDTRNMSVTELENRVIVSLAGRVAEREILGEYYLGGIADIESATNTMMALTVKHAAYGYCGPMSQILGCGRNYMVSEEFKARRDQIIVEKLDEFDKKAETIIRENRELYNDIVEKLVGNRVLSRGELMYIAGEHSAISA